MQPLISWANVSIHFLLFSLVLRKGFLKFEYESEHEGEKTHILVRGFAPRIALLNEGPIPERRLTPRHHIRVLPLNGYASQIPYPQNWLYREKCEECYGTMRFFRHIFFSLIKLGKYSYFLKHMLNILIPISCLLIRVKKITRYISEIF